MYMEDEQGKARVLKAKLENGTTISIQTSMVRGEEDVASKLYSFQEVTKTIEGIAESLMVTLNKVRPQSADVEFGLEVGAESGQLMALLVKGTGTAHLKITLQWSAAETNKGV
jgi:hypothetical protein